LLFTERQCRQGIRHTHRIALRWIRDRTRARKGAVVGYEDSAERSAGPTAFWFGIWWPHGLGDECRAILSCWSEGDVVDRLESLHEVAIDVDSLPTDYDELIRLAAAADVHSA
jgi:hypothetical protein